MNKNVIAVVGETDSGKTTIAEIFRSRGYTSFSGGNILRDIAVTFGIDQETETLIRMGNKLREVFGPEILMRAARLQYESIGGERLLFESIRHPEEVRFLKEGLGAYVVGVTMSDQRRFELMKDRRRAGDPRTWEEFIDFKRREYDNPEAKQTDVNVAACLRFADIIIPNEGTLEDLEVKVDELLASRGILEGNRPAEKR